MSQPSVSEAASTKDNSEPKDAEIKSFPRLHKPVESLLKEIRDIRLTALQKAQKAASDRIVSASRRGFNLGLRWHPYNYQALYDLVDSNPYHQACVEAKINSTVGLGFQSEADLERKRAKKLGVPLEDLPSTEKEIPKIDRVLNPLCAVSWLDTLKAVVEDLYVVGWGALEVVRKGRSLNAPIVGIYHYPAPQLLVYLEDHRAANWHYQSMGDEAGGIIAYAKFGDRRGLMRRAQANSFVNLSQALSGSGSLRNLRNDGLVTEIIPIRNPSARDRFYGKVDYLGAVASIELSRMVIQNEFDFHLNRGVPELLVALIGASLSPGDNARLNATLANHIGQGNQHKTALITLRNPEAKLQVEKLAMDQKGDGSRFAINAEACGSQIVTAHGVPPILAGIQITGKLGAANETVQSLQLFHLLKIGPAQNVIMQALRCTLADSSLNGGLDLSPDDCTLTSLLDEIDLGEADTMARMRQSPHEAAAEGRDMQDGLKD